MAEKISLISSEEILSLTAQCELLGVARSSYYYEPVKDSELNLRIKREIDLLYLRAPFYGSRSMTIGLKRRGEPVNRKRIQRLMREMGLEAMYPKPKTSIGNKAHYNFPYLLKDLKIDKPNQVWGTDITYVPTEDGYLFLVAVLDLYSRYVISWEVSDSLEGDFCIKAMEKALKTSYKPEIMNSDQGCQFTSKAYTNLLKKNDILISMSGRGRCWDNIFVERLWRSYKYEEVYLKEYENGKDVIDGANWYFNFYNNERIHSKLGYCTPENVYFKSITAPVRAPAFVGLGVLDI